MKVIIKREEEEARLLLIINTILCLPINLSNAFNHIKRKMESDEFPINQSVGIITGTSALKVS